MSNQNKREIRRRLAEARLEIARMEYHLTTCAEILDDPPEGENNDGARNELREEMVDVFLGIRDTKEEIEALKSRLVQLVRINKSGGLTREDMGLL